MNKKIKRTLSLMLAGVMGISLCSVNMTKNAEAKTEEKTVFDEIEKINISKNELESIADVALDDGEKAAEKINTYDEDSDFDAALNYALTSYYEAEDFEQLDEFEKTVDNRSGDIIEGYKEASKERENEDKNNFEAGTVIVLFDGEASREEIDAVCEAENGEIKSIYKDFAGDYVAEISISLGQTVDMASETYSKYSIVDSADGNDYIDVEDSSVQGSVNDTNLSSQYYLDSIHVKEAWDYVSTHTHSKVLVGVIDTGVQLDHPDLKNVLSPKSADVTGDSPILLKDCDTTSTTFHGTAVAGVIAAEADNGKQLAGVASCYNNDVVEILAVQASTYYEPEKEYRYTSANLYKAMDYCVEQGAKVVNMSLGDYTYNSTQEEFVNKMADTGIIVVCSAGNEYTDQSHYPSDYDKTISVAATTSNNKLAMFSGYGSQKDICAPGSGMELLNNTSGITNQNGTSFSSPVVAAVSAMMCSINGNLNYYDIKRIMANTAIELDQADSLKVPYGVVNAAECIKYSVGYTPQTLFEHKEKQYKNLAFQKNVTVSSIFNAETFPINNLVDGNKNTKIITESTSGQNVMVDLGQAYDIDKISLYYERSSKTAYSVKISTDKVNWTEVASGNKADQYSKNFEIDRQQARYVKIDFINNDTYVILTELEVYGYIDSQTELKDIYTKKEKPCEALNMTVNWIFPRAVNVNWTEDANRQSKNYTYNVYVDGTLNASGLANAPKMIMNLSLGYHTFKVTACLNGYESVGTSIRVYVSDTAPTTTTAPTTETPTTVLPTTEAPTETPTPTTVTGGPLEVIGMEAICSADNTIEVVWGQDADRINSGCKYNVYVNNEKILDQVTCNRYTIENIEAGTVQVKVTATLNGTETAGVTQEVNVTGAAATTTTTAATTTTTTPTTAATTTAAVAQPLEVIGMVLSSPSNNTVGVVWGQDEARIANGQKYNVYVNGVKVLNEVICASYNLENVDAGNVKVKVTAVLNGIETTGVEQTVTVSGTAQ